MDTIMAHPLLATILLFLFERAAETIFVAWRYVRSEQFIRDCREADRRDRD